MKEIVVGHDEDGHFFAEKILEKEKLFNIIRKNYFDSLQMNVDIDLTVDKTKEIKCGDCGHTKREYFHDTKQEKKIEEWLKNLSDEDWTEIVKQTASRGCFEVIEINW